MTPLPNCDVHECHSTDIAALKTTIGTIKWGLQFWGPIGFVVLSSFAALAYGGIITTLGEIKGDLRIVRDQMASSAVAISRLQSQTETNTRQIEELREQLNELRRRSK